MGTFRTIRDAPITAARARQLTIFAAALLLLSQPLFAEPVAVRYTEGSLHGFLVLRSFDGKVLADGDALQTMHGDNVTSRMTFHFKDGSLFDQTTVFSQRERFKLVNYHLLQKGPSFPQLLELSIEGASGQVVVHYSDDDGSIKETREHFDLPADVANGMIGTLLKNARPAAPPKSLSLIAATPAPRLIKLAISSAGRDSFAIAGSRREATHYVIRVELGAIAGFIAELAGKQPPDSHLWVSQDTVPVVVKVDQPFFVGSPLWRIELAGTEWPRQSTDERVAATRNPG